MKRVICLAYAIALVFSAALSVGTVLESEQSLLGYLVGGGDFELSVSITLIQKAQRIAAGEILAIFVLPEGLVRVVTDSRVVTLSSDGEISEITEASDTGILSEVKIIDAFSLVSLQSREEVRGIFLVQEENGLFWHVITETMSYRLASSFASTLSVTANEKALEEASERLRKSLGKEEDLTPSEKPGKPDDPGKPDEP
ncbi:MAG: hypothetical protein PHW28_07350, partial [Mesotoga sp.]|nr:hypothetical protein [Mesotoga sp.]